MTIAVLFFIEKNLGFYATMRPISVNGIADRSAATSPAKLLDSQCL
jgi:hypothetical protein